MGSWDTSQPKLCKNAMRAALSGTAVLWFSDWAGAEKGSSFENTDPSAVISSNTTTATAARNSSRLNSVLGLSEQMNMNELPLSENIVWWLEIPWATAAPWLPDLESAGTH